MPDGIQGCLQFQESSGGTKKESDDADDSGRDAGTRPGGAFQHGLDCLGTLPPNQALNLAHDFAPHRFGAEDKAADGNGNYQDRGKSKESVIRQGGAQPGNIVVPPAGHGAPKNRPQRSHRDAGSSSPGNRVVVARGHRVDRAAFSDSLMPSNQVASGIPDRAS